MTPFRRPSGNTLKTGPSSLSPAPECPHLVQHLHPADSMLAVLGRGVAGRVVYALDVLEMPEVVEFIEATQPAGEQARTVASLPMPLLIVDRQVGFLPLGTDRPNYFHDFLLVHRSALLETLVMVFESVWERAAPFESGASPSVGNDGTVWSPSTDERRMLALLRHRHEGCGRGPSARDRPAHG